MKILKLILCLGIIFLIQSCSNEIEPTPFENNHQTSSISKMLVKFENQIFETEVKTTGDSVEYLNKEFDRFYQSNIATNPNIATLLCTDDAGITHVEYFKSESELLGKYQFLQGDSILDNLNSNNTRSGIIDLYPSNNQDPILAKAELYEHADFKGTALFLYSTTSWANAIGNFKEYGVNDKTSSIRVFNYMNPNAYYTIKVIGYPDRDYLNPHTHKGSELRPVFRFYKDAYQEGSVLYCIASPSGSSVTHQDFNLKGIKWNDKISSSGVSLVFDFSVFYGDNPEIPDHKPC